MSHITLATPQTNLVGFRDSVYNIAHQITFNDDVHQRIAGGGTMGMTNLTSFSGGASATCAYFAASAGTQGVVIMTTTLTGVGGQSAAAGVGYFVSTRPIILTTTQSMLYQCRLSGNTTNLWGGSTRYIFFGLSSNNSVNSAYVDAIGFRIDNNSFKGDRFIVQPVCCTSSTSTLLGDSNGYWRKTTDVGDVFRTYMFYMQNIGGSWKVSFYKLWETGTTVGSAGQWVELGTITTNIPSSVILSPIVTDVTIGSSIGSAGTDEIKYDYKSIRIFNTVKRF